MAANKTSIYQVPVSGISKDAIGKFPIFITMQ
jgi:hypothetical protein